jgi:hypothetical protein
LFCLASRIHYNSFFICRYIHIYTELFQKLLRATLIDSVRPMGNPLHPQCLTPPIKINSQMHDALMRDSLRDHVHAGLSFSCLSFLENISC